MRALDGGAVRTWWGDDAPPGVVPAQPQGGRGSVGKWASGRTGKWANGRARWQWEPQGGDANGADPQYVWQACR